MENKDKSGILRFKELLANSQTALEDLTQYHRHKDEQLEWWAKLFSEEYIAKHKALEVGDLIIRKGTVGRVESIKMTISKNRLKLPRIKYVCTVLIKDKDVWVTHTPPRTMIVTSGFSKLPADYLLD